VIPKGWKLGKIRDIASVITGTTPSTNDPDNYGDEYFFVSPADLGSDKYVTITEKMISSKGFLHSRSVRKGSTLFTCIGSTIGKVGIAGQELATNQQINAVVCDRDKADDEYVYYALDFLAPQIRLLAGTQAVPIINKSTFENQKLLLPPLPEQRAIAAILNTWDEAIALTERRIEAAQQHKKSLMQRLLTGRVRFPEFVRSERGQETQFGYLPIDWKVVPLQKLVKPVSRPETIQPGEEYEFIGVKWYVAGAHIHSVLSGQDIKTTSLSRIEENDIVYNKMWTTKAAFAVAKPEHSGAYGTTEYPQFRAKENMLFVGFLEYIFHLARFQYDATALCRGTTGRARLNPRDFLKLEIPLPSLEEQHRIAAVLQTCEREIEVLTQKRDALQRQKKGLMQRLLTGRVRVSV
jgi:type I restriction enzyme S subunit